MIVVNNIEIPYKEFPDKTPMLLNLPAFESNEVNITWLYEPNEYFRMYSVCCHYAIQHEVTLFVPYLPNARMDRTSNPNECFTLKYMCQMLAGTGIKHVKVFDIHSDATRKIINEFNAFDFEDCANAQLKCIIDGLIKRNGYQVVCFPDEGARKRYQPILALDIESFSCLKKRQGKNMNVASVQIPEQTNVNNKSVLIIDDICSYGGTIVKVSEQLHTMGASNIDVYVSHCENSIMQGKIPDIDYISNIYTTNSIFRAKMDKIHVIKTF